MADVLWSLSKTFDSGSETVGSSLRGVCEALWLKTQSEGYPLADWIADRREAGEAWRVIANEIRDRTDGDIDLPAQTLLNWYGNSDQAAA